MVFEIDGRTRWISSLGGPLILMDQSASANWGGDRKKDTSFSQVGLKTDYDRVCEVVDYVERIAVDGNQALVLGDLPSDTTWIRTNSKELVLVRWIWAEHEDHVLNTLTDFQDDQPWVDTGIVIFFASGELILFDSVYAGNEMTDFLKIRTESGNFRVSTLSYQPTEQLNLFMIRLKQLTGTQL